MKHLIPSLKALAILSLITGVLYPAAITLIANAVFPQEATGQFHAIRDGEPARGALLIAQEFKTPRYFASRPSAIGYNPMPSGGSNLGPTSDALKKQIDERKAAGATTADMQTASGSGLDPHISPASAQAQIERVAHARGLDADRAKKLESLVEQLTEEPTFGILGEQRVNVLRLNLEMDRSGL